MKMTKYEQLKQAVRKLIKPKCEDCKDGYYVGEEVVFQGTELGRMEIQCKTCNGKGYIEELGHSLICNENSFSKESCNCGASIDLTLQEILLALSNTQKGFSMRINIDNEIIFEENDELLFSIPLNLTPDQYSEELLDKLIEIL